VVVPKLEIKHLELVKALKDYGRVSDAADSLGLTPSALSHRLKEAERRLGIDLYQRAHKRLKPLPTVDHLSLVAESVIETMDRAEADLLRMKAGLSYSLRLGVETYSSYFWLPAFVAECREKLNGVDIEIVASATSDPMRALRNDEVDLAFVSQPPVSSTFSLSKILEDELLFVMPPNHSLAGKEFVEAEDIEGESFITFTRVPQPGREYETLFRPANRFPKWTATVESPEAIVELISAGMGTSILAAWPLRKDIEANRVTTAKLGNGGLKLDWWAVHKTEHSGEKLHPETLPRAAALLGEVFQKFRKMA